LTDNIAKVEIPGLEVDRLEIYGLEFDRLEIDGLEIVGLDSSLEGAIIVSNNEQE